MSDKEVKIKVDATGLGRVSVPYNQKVIERVRVLYDYGNIHIRETDEHNVSWIVVLGAYPNSEVTVAYRVQED